MQEQDTINLLKECDSGSKMAVSSIDEVMDKAQNSSLRSVLVESKQHHEELGNEIHTELARHHSEEKDPNPVAKGMSWMKTNMKMSMEQSDSTIANLITDGCDMGITSLQRYLNQYKEADSTSKDLCRRLMSIEDKLREDMRGYL